MAQNFRIGMVLSRYYPYEGGAEVQCRRLSHELSKSGMPVFVLTQRMPHLPSHDKIDGVDIFRVGLPVTGKFGSLSFVLAGLFWLALYRKHFTLLHAHLASSSAILGGLASLLLRKPSVVKIAGSRRSGDIATSRATWYGKLKLLFLRASQKAFICPSNEIRDELNTAGFPVAKIHVIPNGADIETFAPVSTDEKRRLRVQLGLPETAVVTVYLGRLEPGKGLEILLRAWAAVEKSSLPEKSLLLIVGKGSLETALKDIAAPLTSVHFPGWRDSPDRYLKAGDLFVLPSSGEGMPNALIEAMACGLGCIATDIGGVNEIVQDGVNGILIPGNDHTILENRLIELLNDDNRRRSLGNNARSYILNNLRIERIAGRYRELYNSLGERGEE